MFKSTLDMIPNGVLLIDIKEKKINFANKELESLVGVDTSLPRETSSRLD